MIQLGMNTNRGVRRMKNEDACHICEEHQVFIVADGVGGNNSGELASRMAVDYLSSRISRGCLDLLSKEEEIRSCFSAMIREANRLIFRQAASSPDSRGMATTLVLAYLAGKKAFVFNVGDSRAYRYRKGVLEQITEDHSFVNTLVQIGTITREEARFHPKKNIITRALGAEEEVEADFFPVDLEPEDILVLCTDGLHGEAGDEEILQIIREEEDMQDLCDRLVQLANDKGGSDNITIICLRYKGESHEC